MAFLLNGQMARTCALTTYTTTASRYSFGDQTDRFLHRRTAALFYALHSSDHEVGAVRALTKPTTAKIALIYKKSEAIFASCRWICRALRDRQIQSPLATNFAAGKISSSAALASCGHLRPCKLPWMQVQLPWGGFAEPFGIDKSSRLRRQILPLAKFPCLRAFSTLCQSVDFVNILTAPTTKSEP